MHKQLGFRTLCNECTQTCRLGKRKLLANMPELSVSMLWYASSKKKKTCFVTVMPGFLFCHPPALLTWEVNLVVDCVLHWADLLLSPNMSPTLSSPPGTGVAQQQEDLDLDKEFWWSNNWRLLFLGFLRVAYMHMCMCMHSFLPVGNTWDV